MKILSRKVREGIVLTCPDGRTVLISVAEIMGPTAARIAIQAPKEMKILRSEIEPRGSDGKSTK